MARRARELYPHQYYHFIHRSTNKIHLFRHEKDFRTYLGLAHACFRQYKVKCFHYVLMHTHVHFVLQMPDRVKHIPQMMKLLGLNYTWYFKKKYDYQGSLWRGRYKNELIDNDRYMLACGVYIEHNPVKAVGTSPAGGNARV